nr:putative lipid II flippase FtsW [Desulfobaculum xiamenense]
MLCAALMLLCTGMVMVMSASGVMASRQWGDPYMFFRRQALFTVAGLGIMTLCYFVSRRAFYALTYLWLVGAALLIVLTLTPLGVEAGGARRWLRLGGFSLQPLEFAKIGLVFYLAYFFSHKQEQVKTFSVGFLPPVMITGMLCGLLLLQPDFGGAVFLCGILFLMSLVGGTSLVYLGSSVILGGGCAWLLISQEPYRIKRWTAFLHPFENAQDSGYQLVQSLYAFGSGGWTGAGLGAGKQKLLFLPEAHNDFIMAVVGEELGFIGVSLVFLVMGTLLWRGFVVALSQENIQDRYTALGMVLVIAMGAVMNMAVVLGAAPPKGVPMPFLSYGGSSLFVSCFCVGMLLNLSRRRAG